jgi:hypothetical protein
MNSAVEIHDSTLASVEAVSNDVIVRLSPAYVHRSEGRPGVDNGTGSRQDVDLIIRGAIVESSPIRIPCWLADGTLSAGETSWDNCIPLPLDVSGATVFEAVTENGEKIVISGVGAEALLKGDALYFEEFCSKKER